jgi:hypothetical protein
VFFGDDHGEEVVVRRRDANWARGNSAVTNALLLSAVWVLGAVFADRNAPALGGILNQQGVGSSTIKILLVLVQIKYCLSNGKLIDASFT